MSEETTENQYLTFVLLDLGAVFADEELEEVDSAAAAPHQRRQTVPS
ncbi:MAG: hypothetical protein ACOCXE_05670 [Spirochaetota bacterium]